MTVEASRRYRARHPEIIQERNRQWRESNQEARSEYAHGYHILQKYGLTRESYQQMLLDQNGVCAICEQASEKRLAVDHDHTTGEVRGLVCTICNLLISHVERNPDLVNRALEYLQGNKRHGANGKD